MIAATVTDGLKVWVMRVLVVSRHSTLMERALLGRTLRRNSFKQGLLLI
jgi:hypothetical protein